MTAEIRWLWSRLNANYWFYPALFSLVGAALAFTLIWLDRNGFAEWLNQVPQIVPARPDGASNMLTVIAGSMIGVASTVFSITIAAVAYASGTYGPRLLTNFMEDKGNQLSLATFIGTFVYAITVLRTVRAEDEVAASAQDAASTALPGFVPQLSLLVAYGLMALSVAVLVYFLNHVPSSIRINTVLEGIGRRLLDQVREEYPEPNTAAEPESQPAGRPVMARGTGYVQLVDFEDLGKLSEKHGCSFALKVRTGDFVHPGMALAEVSGEVDIDAVERSVTDAFILGATRTPKQDPQFLIDELVEIALRALSPGINDPFTAITALHWLGAATADLGTRDLRKNARNEADAKYVYPLPDDFAHYLKRGFGNVRSAVATSPNAAQVMFDTLHHASLPIDDESRVALLRTEGRRLLEQARERLVGPDLQDVEARYVGFERAFEAR
ncbi:hypothetical protein A6F68_00963 [Tsuneonella dongtanensis]|uniref:DUF2254 domain-containing protein n=1 Tax=Tsuneonella dongtanensis TaxID=692370 RepID=A0A1B2ABN0_9SPHN|nr:DUF2254 domain-containing protein [Tsuneonella dongtanensis]ANY19488.1 hypothetical protein A6F68_00963 [Tsuneonella dongtanensis]